MKAPLLNAALGLVTGSLPSSVWVGRLAPRKEVRDCADHDQGADGAAARRRYSSCPTSRCRPSWRIAVVLLAAVWALGGSAVGRAAAYPSAQRPLESCDFITTGTGWAVGDEQVVLRTVTAGTLWLRQRSLAVPASALLDVGFADRDLGWAAGEDGLVLSTLDAGASWTASHPLTGATWGAVAAAGGGTVVVAGSVDQPEPTGVLLRSADNGGTWVQVAALSGVRLDDICFSDRQRGWAVGTRTVATARRAGEALVVLQTVDGGATWTELVMAAAATGLDRAALTSLYAVAAVGALDVWCAGRVGGAAAGRGLLLHSVDGGVTWLATISSTFSSFSGLSFSAHTRGWVVGSGAGAALAATRDGGATWRKQRLPAGSRARAVDFVDARRGWVVGDTSRHKGLVARTRDAGATWVRVR